MPRRNPANHVLTLLVFLLIGISVVATTILLFRLGDRFVGSDPLVGEVPAEYISLSGLTPAPGVIRWLTGGLIVLALCYLLLSSFLPKRMKALHDRFRKR